MRATEGNRRGRHSRRLSGVVVAVALALTAVGGGIASGANSRILYVGTNLVDASGTIVDLVTNVTGAPPADGIPDNAGVTTGVLIPTPVNAGYSTAVPIQVFNADNQTIAHVNLSFPAVGKPSLAANGLAVTDIGGTDAGACSTVGSPTVSGVSCSFENLRAGAVRSLFIVVSTTVPTEATNIVSAQVTTNNENGSNLQLFEALSGSFKVLAANANGLNAFVAPGQAARTFNTNAVGGSNKLQTTLDFTQSAGGNLVAIAESGSEGGGTTFLYACPIGLTCQAAETTVTVQDGLTGAATQFASPFLRVTLTALVPKTYTLNKAFVAHYGASATTPDWVLYWSTKATRCGADVAATLATIDQCFNSATLSRPNADGTQTLVLQVTTKSNGGMRY